ncbi:heme peroxidase [Mucidula mucida]|nr:heme peroxidase [Mucidula mucida]
MFVVPACVLVLLAPHVHAYTWPSPQDWLEEITHRRIDGVAPCSFSSAGAGRQTAAEWVRTGFHDMITHNAVAGSGGLDASIMFETERAENPGEAFNTTLGFMLNYYNNRASMADLIALGVYTAVRACSGPPLLLRVGRVDAADAGPEGVPEPTDTLASMTAQFEQAGFSTSDMIKMVACGHTLGGVHGSDFPEITGDSNATNFVHFDGTFSSFDGTVVNEYLNGSTSNPLVVGPTDTNSDLRIFGADGNVTMQSMSAEASFKSSCLDILQRMIDTVPASVTLSEVISPVAVKPMGVDLALADDGTLTFSGDIRVTTKTRPDFGQNLTVQLTYADHEGNVPADNIITTTMAGTGTGLEEAFNFYHFSQSLPNGVSSFNVSISSSAGDEFYDNGGAGFPIQDTVLFHPTQSCLLQEADHYNLTVVAAVRNELAQVPDLDITIKTPRPGVIVPALTAESITMSALNGNAPTGYTLYTASHVIPSPSQLSSFDVVAGDYSDLFKRAYLLPTTCA